MVDSGAFSAMTRGAHVDIDAYADYLLENKGLWRTAVNLDVIPHAAVKPQDAARLSIKNHEHLRRRGIETMPVFHRGERIEHLKAILSEKPKWIGLGFGRSNRKTRRTNLAHVMETCAGTRTHLFGVSSIDLIRYFKPFSFDSTSVQGYAMTGMFQVFTNNKVHVLHTDQLRGAIANLVRPIAESLDLTLEQVVRYYWARARISTHAVREATKGSRFYVGQSRDPHYLPRSFLPVGVRRILFSYWHTTEKNLPISLRRILGVTQAFYDGTYDYLKET